MRRLFSTFPGGWLGIGLLLLRFEIGSTAIAQGAFYYSDDENLAFAAQAAALLFLVSGVAALIGLWTPLAAAFLATGAIAAAFSWLPVPSVNLFDARPVAILVTIVNVAVVLTGPGSLSVDARLFGRREIIIPQSPRSPRL